MLSCCSRRTLLRTLFFGAPGAAADKALVVVFLRGGADGLNMVVPHFEKAYYQMRPTLSIAKKDCIDLDGRFGFHPSFEPLAALFKEKRLAVVHAAGSDDDTRSHFEAQDQMERAGRFQDGTSGGWLARHLRSRGGPAPSALSAVAISTSVPESLRGGQAAAIADLSELSLGGRSRNADALRGALQALYAGSEDPVEVAGRETLEVIERLRALRIDKAGDFPETEFGRGLRQVAALIRADVGLEIATVDLDGWDTHFTQGTTSGPLAGNVKELADGLAAFAKVLGNRLDRAVVVVQTEFGRRVYENGSFGTDHGRGGVMLLMGAGIAGGKVITEWPGLEGNALEGPGDLPVTIDYREVLAEVVSKVLGNDSIDRVFPGLKPRYRGVVAG